MIKLFLAAFALMLILESIFPLFFPGKWRATLQRLAKLDERSLRFIGVIVFSIGIILWCLVANTGWFD